MIYHEAYDLLSAQEYSMYLKAKLDYLPDLRLQFFTQLSNRLQHMNHLYQQHF